jgi:hypothetical protein
MSSLSLSTSKSMTRALAVSSYPLAGPSRAIQPRTRTNTSVALVSAAGKRSFATSRPAKKERLVILGSGWGGYQVLRCVDKKRWGEYHAFFYCRCISDFFTISHRIDVTVVSPNGHFAFTPLLAGCAVGTLELRSTLEPVSNLNHFST